SDETLIFSRSHPNSSRWYSNREVAFSWRNDDATEYQYLFNTTPTSSVDTGTYTTDQQVTLTAPDDGIYYLHLQARSNDGVDIGEVVSYRVQIDTAPPATPALLVSTNEPSINEIVRFDFSSSDDGSGLQERYFYFSFDDGLLLPVQSPFSTAFQAVGNYTVKVRAFDNAQNYTDAKIEIRVRD
ncbi:MAG: hypothetical protein AAFO91_16110, partial [Bacteroidota bacterium]